MSVQSERTSGRWAWVVAGAIVVVMAVAMRIEGRLWISESGRIKVWHSDVWSSECSQQFADPYSVTHVSHGLIFAGVFWLVGGALSRRLGWKWAGDWRWQLAASVGIAAGWEVLENSPIIIDRYRSVTMSLDYMGDTVFNAVGDVVSCGVGFFIARRIGLWWTVGLFVATELLLLWLIRDNLTLNVIMLIHPIEAIKQWQQVSAPAAG